MREKNDERERERERGSYTEKTLIRETAHLRETTIARGKEHAKRACEILTKQTNKLLKRSN